MSDKALARVQKMGVVGITASVAALADVKLTKSGKIRKKRPFKHHPKSGRLLRVCQLLFAGYSTREIRAQCGTAKATVSSVRKSLEKFVGCRLPCPCGLPLTHQGFCSFRLKRHPKRQAWLRDNWHHKAKADA